MQRGGMHDPHGPPVTLNRRAGLAPDRESPASCRRKPLSSAPARGHASARRVKARGEMKEHTITTKRSIGSLLAFLVTSTVTGCMTTPEAESPDDNALPADVAAETVSATTQSLFGSDSCKKVDLTVRNSRTRDGEDTLLMIHYVQYHSVSEGSWYTEQLDDKLLFFGDSYTWWNQDLAHAENDLVDQWKVVYEFYEDGAWSSLVQQTFPTPGHICHADDNFSFTVE
jgi:hypothetical protein